MGLRAVNANCCCSVLLEASSWEISQASPARTLVATSSTSSRREIRAQTPAPQSLANPKRTKRRAKVQRAADLKRRDPPLKPALAWAWIWMMISTTSVKILERAQGLAQLSQGLIRLRLRSQALRRERK